MSNSIELINSFYKFSSSCLPNTSMWPEESLIDSSLQGYL